MPSEHSKSKVEKVCEPLSKWLESGIS